MLQGRRALKKYGIYYISAGGLVSIYSAAHTQSVLAPFKLS